MSNLAFNHLLVLPLGFHLKRNTPQIGRIMDRVNALSRISNLVVLHMGPAFLDICVALVIFVWKFGWELALITCFVMAIYGAWSARNVACWSNLYY